MHYFVADAGDRLAGQYAVMPIRLQHRGQPLLGLLSLHTATDPDFERRGIFTALARELYARAASEAPIVYGFPNPNSGPALYRKLGWVELRPFPILIRPLGNTRGPVVVKRPRLSPLAWLSDSLALLALVPAWAVKHRFERTQAKVVELDSFDVWADELWDEISPLLGTCAVRDAAFLQWRFAESPFRYTLYGLDRGAGPSGFAVLGCRPWRGGKVADLMELIVRSEDRSGADLLVAKAVLDAWSMGAIALRAIVSPRHPHRGAFLKAGFLPVPERFKSDFSFGVGILDAAQLTPNEVLHIDDWYISGADLDYI